MKLMDVKCCECGCEMEELVANDTPIGSFVDWFCPACNKQMPGEVLPCFCGVRTPNNSASFLDGHRTGGDSLEHRLRVLRAETARDNAKYKGIGDIKDTEQHLAEVKKHRS